MSKEFGQTVWDASVEEDARELIRLAVREDLERWYDWTTVSLAGEGAAGLAKVMARQDGVVCGLRVAGLVVEEMNLKATWTGLVEDGTVVSRGMELGVLEGNARDLLTAERTILNFLGHLSGISTLTKRFVDAIAGTGARLYDTRKTTPGYRRLEKYAVRCGGGHNHRLGLYDAVLIKDNHLALGRQHEVGANYTPSQAVEQARKFVKTYLEHDPRSDMMIEVEVDSLEQLKEVLPANPDIVLLDNMTCEQLREAVAIRNALQPTTELEASGGINLSTVRGVAETGVDRISSGALTHSAICLDVALDWTL